MLEGESHFVIVWLPNVFDDPEYPPCPHVEGKLAIVGDRLHRIGVTAPNGVGARGRAEVVVKVASV